MTTHIHDDPRIDCPACAEWIKSPVGRLQPTYKTKKDEQQSASKTKKLRGFIKSLFRPVV